MRIWDARRRSGNARVSTCRSSGSCSPRVDSRRIRSPRKSFSRARPPFDGEARRGHGFGEGPLGVHAPHPVGERLHVAQDERLALGQIQHLLPAQAEAFAHPQPMLGVRFFDADVLDQERPGEVVLDLDQALGQKLREIVDERVELEDPSLHLFDAEPPRGDRFRPDPVDQIVPMGGHEFVHRGDPPRVRSHFAYRTGIHRLLPRAQVVESRIEAGTALVICGMRIESAPVRAGRVPGEAGARNGVGGEIQLPCAKSTPISRSLASPISPSTNSPIVFLPITCPTSLMARTIAKSTGSWATSLMKLPSILMKSTGKCLRYPKEDMPAPKSSSENRHPSDFSSPKNRAALSKLAIAAVSVTSKQMLRGGMT